jgi:CRP/FNR family cyclic AMP-dependent transcriptional regulator
MDKELEDYFKKNQSQLINFEKSEIILRPFHNSTNIYAINSGLVKVYSYDSRGKENIAVIYGPGDFFPLAWLINQKRPSVYFKSLSECSFYIIPQDVFQEAIKNNSDLSAAFVQRVVKQFALYASTLNNLGLKYARERLCYRLLVMAARYGETRGDEKVIPYITHNDLAATINITREGVTKEISRLEKIGVIKYDRSNIVIKNIEHLQQEVGKGVPVIFFDSL